MVKFWDDHGGAVAVPVIDGSLLTGVAIRVQVEHAVRLTEATLLLVRKGLFVQVAPLVRMTLECAVSAAWWTLSPSHVKGSLAEAARLKGPLMKGLGGLVGKPDATHPDWVEVGEEVSEFRSGQAKYFQQQCNALSGGAGLYAYYWLLSE